MDLVQATFNGQILHPCAPSLTFSTDSHHKSLIWPNLWPKIEYIYRKYYFAIGLVISTHKFAKEQQFIFHKKGNDKKTQIIFCCWNTIKCCRSWSYLHSTAQRIVEMLMHYGATWNGVKWRHCSRWNSKALIFLSFLRKRSFDVKSCAIDSNATNIDQSEIMQLSNFPFEQQSMSATHSRTHNIDTLCIA